MEKVALCFLAALSLASCMHLISVPEDKPVPKFNVTYVANATLMLPYAEIKEPLQVWFDAPNNRSRVDYYDGIMKTYQRGDLNPPCNRKVVYMTTETQLNELTCLEVNLTGNGTIASPIQSILPDLKDYHYLTSNMFNDKICDIWEKTETDGQKDSTYRFWAHTDERNKTIPVRFEMMGRNPLLGGSHYDKYEVVYHYYLEVDNIDEEIFETNLTKSCQNFPGPGVEREISMNPLKEFINSEDDHVNPMFDDFKDKHNKNYDGLVEHEERKKNFLHNLRFIHSHNRAGKSYSLKVNHLADWTDDEMKVLRGRIHSNSGGNNADAFDISNYIVNDLPPALDWRLFGAVTPVKDQAVCGSCWSFGTAGTIEGANFIKNQKLERLSEQALVDCSWGEGNNGCDGGEDYRAYEWIKRHGIPKTKDYGPYMGIDAKCHVDSTNKTNRIFIKSYVNVTTGDDLAVKTALLYHGPLSVSIDASHKSFGFYANGVYEDPACKSDVDDLDHSVLAVGYGVIANRPYWLIKNSWSTYWGNDGYILINQKNDCGVSTQATYVVL